MAYFRSIAVGTNTRDLKELLTDGLLLFHCGGGHNTRDLEELLTVGLLLFHCSGDIHWRLRSRGAGF